jgi:gamma-glutamylputrescine oxidase
VQRHLDGWLAELGVAAAVTHRWAARAAFTEDHLPVDERVAPGVHVVGAYSGHGNVLGPLLAREAALRLLDAA